MTFVGARFLEQFVFKEKKKLEEKERARVTKKKETQKEKKDRLTRSICRGKISWTNSI